MVSKSSLKSSSECRWYGSKFELPISLFASPKAFEASPVVALELALVLRDKLLALVLRLVGLKRDVGVLLVQLPRW